MKRGIIFLFIFIFLISFISAGFGFNNVELPKVEKVEEEAKTSSIFISVNGTSKKGDGNFLTNDSLILYFNVGLKMNFL